MQNKGRRRINNIQVLKEGLILVNTKTYLFVHIYRNKS